LTPILIGKNVSDASKFGFQSRRLDGQGPFVDPIGDDTPPTGPTSSNEKKAPKAEPPEANTHYDPRAKHQ
jgi:hypothetical protein